jgi:RNA-directed DNA polymerase
LPPAWASPPCGTGWSRPPSKLVLEPIFEADFQPCSVMVSVPRRRAQDAIAEIHYLDVSRSYEWVVEGDIKACFDEISHCAVSWTASETRVGDKRVLGSW